MKVLVLLFLIGCASAFAPRYDYNEVDDALAEREYRSNLEEKVREEFEKILEKIKDAIEDGKTVKEEYLERLQELKQKLKDLHIDISAKAKELLEKIKDKAKEFMRKILDKLGLKDKNEEKRAYEFEELYKRSDDDGKNELEQELRKHFEEILEKIKDAIEHGKVIKEETLVKLKELKEKLHDLHVDMGKKAKELLEKIKEKAKDFLKNLWEKLGLKDKESKRGIAESEEFVKRDADEMREKLEQKLRERYNELLEKMKEALERGEVIKEEVLDKIKKVHEKMKDLKITIGEKAKELLDKIKEKSKDFIDRLREKLGWKDKEARSVEGVEELIRRAEGKDMEQKIKDAFDKVLEKVKEAVEKGKAIEQKWVEDLKSLMEKMKEKGISISEKAKELLQKIKDKAREFIKTLLEKLDKLGKKEESHSVARIDWNIKDVFKKLKDALLSKLDKEAIKAKIEKLFGKGTELADSLLEILKSKGEKGKQKLLDLVDKYLDDKEEETRDTRSIQEIYEKVRNYFEKLGIELKEKYVNFGKWVKENVKKGIDASKTEAENIKAIAKEFVDKADKLRKDVVVEALEFLRPYKEDMGTLWEEVKKSVKDVLGKQD